MALGIFCVRQADPTAASHLERGRELARAANSPRIELRAINALAVLAAQSGELDEALKQFRAAYAVAREHQFEEVVPMLLDNIAIILRRQGQLDEALVSAEEGLVAAQKIGNLSAVATFSSNLSELQLLRGDAFGAEASARRALKFAQRMNSEAIGAPAFGHLGAALNAQGKHREAIVHHQHALELAERLGWPDHVASTLVHLAIAYLATDTAEGLDQARVAGERALSTATNFPLERGRALHVLGQIAVRDHSPSEAQRMFTDALSAIGNVSSPESQQIQRDLDELAETGEPTPDRLTAP